MATNRTTVIPIGIMPKTKRNFVMVFMETIRISVMVSIVFLFCFFSRVTILILCCTLLTILS